MCQKSSSSCGCILQYNVTAWFTTADWVQSWSNKWAFRIHALKGRSHGHCDEHRMCIQSSLLRSHESTWNPMRIQCALSPIHLRRWIGNGLKLDQIIIHDLREVTPTMRSLACTLAWLFMVCGTCYIVSFCSALAVTLGKKDACFLKAEKSDATQ